MYIKIKEFILKDVVCLQLLQMTATYKEDIWKDKHTNKYFDGVWLSLLQSVSFESIFFPRNICFIYLRNLQWFEENKISFEF